jgi:outer membrane protein OmpA-like peptidoglycan-associated protein
VTRDSVLVPVRIHFAFTSSALNADATGAVAAAVAYMTYRPEAILDITGHTDPIGSDDANDKLGQTRADAVVAALTARSVEPGRIHAQTMGEHAARYARPQALQREPTRRLRMGDRAQNGGGGGGTGYSTSSGAWRETPVSVSLLT